MEVKKKLAGAVTTPFWLSTVEQGPACPALTSSVDCDLAVIGGGFTGLWSALKARERDPGARIVLVEAARCGGEASGRNGGFCAPSISHGVSNALNRWPDEAERLIRLGRENLDELARDLDDYHIDGGFERSGKLNIAATPWQADGLKSMARNYDRFGIEYSLLEGDALREKFDSPVYSTGLFEPNYALVNPARLVAGLRDCCINRGVMLHEDTPVTTLRQESGGISLQTAGGQIRASKVILATNAAVPLIRRLRPTIIPIFDYSLVTEPLSDAQLAGIGWTGRNGVADSGNQFHYLRKTADNRMLWAGFDAIYHYGSSRERNLLNREKTFDLLAHQFAEAFPSLSDVKFDYAWGGIIDTSARSTFFTGTACSGRVAYALGFTGQGVSASRFAGLTMLDLLDGQETERTSLSMHRRMPVPFPPEPFRSLAVSMMQKRLAKEDATGKRALLLRGFDAFGIGFDS